jgi:hypothetical protein
VLCYGYENEFHGIDSNLYFAMLAPANKNQIFGGRFKTLYVELGAADNTIIGARYNVYAGGSFSNNGTRTRCRDLHDVLNNKHHNAIPTYLTYGPAVSPYDYTNESGNDETITVIGGTVSYIGHNRNGNGNGVGFTNGQVTLSAGDGLTILYTDAPTLIKASR